MAGEPRDRGPSRPDEQAEVAALLKAAAGPIPTPRDVVERLDGVLAELTADRGTTRTVRPDPAWVRRRRWSQGLLAAAAVLVVGYAGWALPDTGPSGVAGSADTSAGGSALSTRLPAGNRQDAAEALPAPGTEPPKVRLTRLRADLRRALAAASEPTVRARSSGADALARRCPAVPVADAGRVVPVRYGERSAAAVLGSESDGRVPVTVYACDGRVLARTSVDARSAR